MHKTGLIALAETYGVDRRELQQLKLVAESFFEALRNELASGLGVSLKLNGFAQTIATFKDVCIAAPPSRCVFLGSSRRVAAFIRVDSPFARAIVDCLISGRTLPDADNRALTPIEQRLFSDTLATAGLRSAARSLATCPPGNDEVHRIDPAVAESVSDLSEQMGLARITCQLEGAAGILELALPVAQFSVPKTHPLVVSARDSMPAESKARTRLANANAELVAVLGQASMPLDAIRALGRGSILPLRPLKDGLPNVELRCENQVLFSGAVVEHRGWRRFLIQHTGVSDERTDQRTFDA